MKLSYDALRATLLSSVVELIFTRRRFKPGWNNRRRMLCTNNNDLLNSIPGKIAFHYKSPTQPPKYNAQTYGLITVWDLLWQEYRNISPESHDIVGVMPVRTEEDIKQFWQYFNQVLQELSPSEKVAFMNK